MSNLDLGALASSGMTLISRTVMDASGSYIVPNGCKRLRVILFGGGSGGGKPSSGAGGNGGNRNTYELDPSTVGGVGATVAVTIGAGSAHNSSAASSAGGTTYFGSTSLNYAAYGGAATATTELYIPNIEHMIYNPLLKVPTEGLGGTSGGSTGVIGGDSPMGLRGGGGAYGTNSSTKGGGVRCISSDALITAAATIPSILTYGGNTATGAGAAGVGDWPGCGGDGGSNAGGAPSGGGSQTSSGSGGAGANGRAIIYAWG